LESELLEIEEGAKRAMTLLRPSIKLAPADRSITASLFHAVG
jgi:hypothetical protein